MPFYLYSSSTGLFAAMTIANVCLQHAPPSELSVLNHGHPKASTSRPSWVSLTPGHQKLSGPSNCPSDCVSQKLMLVTRLVLARSCSSAIYI